jgi:hypothetical protein
MREWFENKKVAIVGNAASIFSKSNGLKIDSADVVVRLNKGILASLDRKNEKFIGTRTDVWMFNLYNHITIDAERYLHVPVRKMQMNETDNKTGFDSFYPREYYNEMKAVVHPWKMSTGFRAIDYVYKSNASQIHLFGFDWKATPTFYSVQSNDSMHNFRKERLYIEELIKQNSNRFFLYK